MGHINADTLHKTTTKPNANFNEDDEQPDGNLPSQRSEPVQQPRQIAHASRRVRPSQLMGQELAHSIGNGETGLWIQPRRNLRSKEANVLGY